MFLIKGIGPDSKLNDLPNKILSHRLTVVSHSSSRPSMSASYSNYLRL